MPGNHLSNAERAVAAWGAEPPAWVRLLASAADRTSQSAVATQLAKSSGYVSRLINRNYAGDYQEAERQVRAVFGAERLTCPAFGDMALRTCITNRRRTRPANWMHVQLARTCPTCPHNTDIEED